MVYWAVLLLETPRHTRRFSINAHSYPIWTAYNKATRPASSLSPKQNQKEWPQNRPNAVMFAWFLKGIAVCSNRRWLFETRGTTVHFFYDRIGNVERTASVKRGTAEALMLTQQACTYFSLYQATILLIKRHLGLVQIPLEGPTVTTIYITKLFWFWLIFAWLISYFIFILDITFTVHWGKKVEFSRLFAVMCCARWQPVSDSYRLEISWQLLFRLGHQLID